MKPFFSIVTPSLQRESLVQCCQSVNSQTMVDRSEHIIQIDSDKLDIALLSRIEHPNRAVYSCGKRHNNGGNSCRRIALEKATGEYICWNDDDNYLADERVLEDVAEALLAANMPPWALFPINRLGGRFYADPPRSCHVDSMNVIIRRDIAYWPDTDAYGTDGILVDDLMARQVPYAAFPDFRPIGVIPKISFCQ